MTQDEIIQIARRAYKSCEHIPNVKIPPEFIERFAKLVAKHERNEIIEILDASTGYVHMDAIRERGQV